MGLITIGALITFIGLVTLPIGLVWFPITYATPAIVAVGFLIIMIAVIKGMNESG